MIEYIDVDSRVLDDVTGAAPAASPAQPAAASVPTVTVAGSLAILDPLQAELSRLVDAIGAATYDIATTKGEDEARALRKRCVTLRTAADDAYKAWNTPLLAAQKAVRERVATLKTGVEPHEKKLDDAIKAKEKAREDERMRKEAEERERITAIRGRIAKIAGTTAACALYTSQQLDGAIDALQEAPPQEADFGEFIDEAVVLHTEVLSKLRELFAARLADEQQRAAAEAEAVAARNRAAELERQAAADRAERAAQDEAERTARAAKEAADRQAAAVRAKISAIERAPLQAFGKTAAQIQALLDTLIAPTADEFGDQLQAAADAWSASAALLVGAAMSQQQLEDAQAAAKAVEDATALAVARAAEQTAAAAVAAAAAATPAPAPSPAPEAEWSPPLGPSMLANFPDFVQARDVHGAGFVHAADAAEQGVAEMAAQAGFTEGHQSECDDRLAALLISSALARLLEKTELETLSVLLNPDMRAQWAARVDEINAQEQHA